MARDKPVRAAPRPSPVVADRGETGAHHAARLATRATGRGKRHRMQARTASRSRFNSYHNTAPDDQPQLGLRSTTERHIRAGGRLSSVRKLRVPPGSADHVRLGVHRRGHGVAVTGPRAGDVEGWRSPTESSTAPGAPRPYAGLRTSPPPRAEARYGPPRRQLGVNHQPFWAKATEGAAPGWVGSVEPHNNAASHRHNANDLTTGLWLPANANAAPDKENIEGRVVAVLLSETQRD